MLIINIAHQEYSEALDHIIHAIPDMKDIQCTIEFSADHSQSKIIRDFVGKIFDTHHIRAIWRGRFILITDELVNNAIEHGSAHDDLDTCIIHAGLSEKGEFRISLEVHDTGNGKDAASMQDMSVIMDTHTRHKGVYMGKRGRGLFHITEKLVDNLSFSKSPIGGLAVRIEKTLGKKSDTEDVVNTK